ncbi:response regulator transcription factor [Mobiluncus mulieris]|uniref:Response regulator transcription factor n=1 Tax=Mobiluncus mulieris TaxID=2052 RepID=A0A378PFR3_9ACTO|nr:response regulator transcription factor [Mobiluncus mulieris]MCU9969940.1 response regulator transcription factor [Mobiluncus mulieris]MCU9974353.1 response regulator transcription factor [Mobiluncus mulieris]MCV0010420.1 response regulator transcription factor [Mobiluncus mulieris]NMX02238.1 response regulator transcription factor [Mobiluncus mulieris]NMX04444.1 response regulator transcription factor [Mobiluncus mulieris]
MGRVMVTSVESNPIGVPLRTPTSGLETELVSGFVEGFVSRCKQSSTSSVSVFVEPRLEHGYPDLLIVYYNPRRVTLWRENRDSLTKREFRILSYLLKHQRRKHTTASVSGDLGFSVSQVSTSLELLQNCGFLTETNEKWQCMNKTSFFALNRVVSIEAKICKPAKALEQAVKNTVFSSQSYSLFPSGSVFASTRSRFADWGVGIISGRAGKVVLEAVSKPVPVCTTSLRVNEWVARQDAEVMG